MGLAASSGYWRLLACNTAVIPAVNNSGADIDEGRAVVFSGGSMAACGDSNTVGIHGVLTGDSDVSETTKCALYTNGLFLVGVSGTIDFGLDDPVYTTSNGLVDEGTASDVEVGRVIQDVEPASGDSTVKVWMRSLFMVRDLLTHA